MIEIEEILPHNQFEIDTDDSPIDAVVDFLNTNLPEFPSLFAQSTAEQPITAEDLISQELYAFLQRRAWNGTFMFQFQRRNIRSLRSSDFGVLSVEDNNPFGASYAFFVIEAKRLPAPKRSREREYVQGNYGGIERYKRGLHGSGLAEGGIIGYIQDTRSCKLWAGEINAWISELMANGQSHGIHWDDNDRLALESSFKATEKYCSNNTRMIGDVTDTIKLHHYLVILN